MGYYDGYLEKKNSLYHSDTYLGADYSDGIKHWKYIRKYKGKNGKWRYVYFNKAKKFIDTRVTGNAYKEEAEKAQEKTQKHKNIKHKKQEYTSTSTSKSTSTSLSKNRRLSDSKTC